MAIVGRKRKRTTTYYVVLPVNGRQVWEKSGADRRAAERLETQRKRELATGTYTGPAATSRATKVGTFGKAWAEARKNRSASDDRQRLRDHVLSRPWLADLRLDDVKPTHFMKLVDELAESGMPGKTISNVYGVTRTMFRDARLAGLVASDPCVLPRGYIKREGSSVREPYTRAEVVSLTTSPNVDPDRRVFNALAFYLGMREGEVCGRRWRDWDREAEPLGAMMIATQYGDEPLKTGRPRRAPVHPALAAILEDWWANGFELVHLRKPTPSDFIVPPRKHKASRHPMPAHHTKSSAYKAFVESCEQAGVACRSLHSTRHTMITWARRGGARKEVVEKITHNAKGDIVDQYTHFDWDPFCEAVLAIRYVDAHPSMHRGPETPRKSGGAGVQDAAQNVAELHEMASHGPTSIPGASNLFPRVTPPQEQPRQFERQRPRPRGAVRRLLRECVDLATGETPSDHPEEEVAARLRRVAKAHPILSMPTRAGRAS